MAKAVTANTASIIVQQVSVGKPREVEFAGKRVRTSIFKSPVEGAVAVRLENIAGDELSDLSVHGGRDKAVYVYSSDYYEDWARQLKVDTLQDAQFGENLTISGGTDEQVLLGSRFRLGDAEVTVMQPRIPCYKLGIRLNDAAFPHAFWQAGRLGFYLRVEKEGWTERGQSMELIETPDHGITIRRLYEIVTGGSAADARFAIQQVADLDEGWIRRLRQVVKSKHRAGA